MGEIKKFEKEKLVVGVLISHLDSLESLKGELIRLWGGIDLETDPVEFTYTHYYDLEMGTPIYRCFFSFKELIEPDDLPDIKIRTNDIELEYVSETGRTINLDPGILSLSKFILATTKNNVHRIPIRKGIYGEVTLQFKDRDFHPLEWTYPDFQGRENRDILIKIRDMYKLQRKESGA